MQLEELFLKKEELPILNETCFQIPIHPKLLDSSLNIDTSIAQRIFPEVRECWYKELKDSPIYNKVSFSKNSFEDSHIIQCAENGFATGLQISRDHGGGIYFDEEDFNCNIVIPTQYVRFSKEKVREFKFKEVGKYAVSWKYSSTNIDEFSGALFLRNWAIKYMNEVFKQVFPNF